MGSTGDAGLSMGVWPAAALASIALAGAVLARGQPPRALRTVATSVASKTKPALTQIDVDEAERLLGEAPWVSWWGCYPSVLQAGEFVGSHSGDISGYCLIGPVVWHYSNSWDDFPSGHSFSSVHGPLACQLSSRSWSTNQPTPSHTEGPSATFEYRVSTRGDVAEYRCTDTTGLRPSRPPERVAFRVVPSREVPPLPERARSMPGGFQGAATRARARAVALGSGAALALLVGAVASGGAALLGKSAAACRRRRWSVATFAATASLLASVGAWQLRSSADRGDETRIGALVMRPVPAPRFDAESGSRSTWNADLWWVDPEASRPSGLPASWVKLPPPPPPQTWPDVRDELE